MKTKKIALIVFVVLALAGCKKDDGGSKNFPVNEAFATELIAKGIPADIARFFAAATMESGSPNDTTCLYKLTFPNGATREITLQVSPNRQYTPTPGDIAGITQGQVPIYDFHYSSTILADSMPRIDISFYVADAGLLQGTTFPEKASLNDGAGGFGFYLWETGKRGADVSIGSLIEYAKVSGIKVGPLGSIYQLASALSSVTQALELSKQNRAWLDELNALQECAANPTNPISRSDPNYSLNTVAKIASSRYELQMANSVRFLNIMTETGSDIIPATAVLSIGLKPAFLWSEQTLNEYSESTIMREARLAVVPCNDSLALEGNVDVEWECTDTGLPPGIDHEVWKVQTKVRWVPTAMPNYYVGEGTYIFTYTKTWTSPEGVCTQKMSAAGRIDGTGALSINGDKYTQDILGFAYCASGSIFTQVVTTNDCNGYSAMEPYTIEWLPPVQGFPIAGVNYRGEMTLPSCTGSSVSGTLKVKWSFSVPLLK